MLTLTKLEREELNHIRSKRAILDGKVYHATESWERPIPVNLALEARHLRLQEIIIQLSADIREAERRELGETVEILKQRRYEHIARAKEVGRMNRFFRDLSRLGNDFEVTNI